MRFLVGLALGSVLLSGQAVPTSGMTKAHGDRFQQKLTRIVDFGNAPRTKARANQSTQVTDIEVNSYLRYNAKDQIPVGIVEPTLNAMGDGRVSGRAIVDLDAVRKQKQRGWLDPVAYLTGRLPITARGKLTTENGVGRFELESAEISGVTIPKSFVQELLSFYSKTAEDPDGINMDDPFKLPAKINQIKVGTGTTTVVQ